MSFQDYSNSTSSRLRLGTITPHALVGAIAIIGLVLACVGLAFFGFGERADGFAIESSRSSASSEAQEAPADDEAPLQADICVHVGGCVNAPGICYLKEGDRVADAIERAGGMTAEAAPDAVNLARAVADGEQIIVASAADLAAQAAVSHPAEPQVGATAATSTSSGKVNINTATSQELQTVSGIGEAKAQKIIAYREKSGPFKTVDDLVNVNGIGEKTLENLRPYVCV